LKKILIVEDDEASQYIYRTLLEKAGYAVDVYHNPMEALAAAGNEPPALVIMDVGLPEIDGIELTRLFRANASTATVPIMVLTVFAFGSEREKALAAGANCFLSKPTEWDDIMRMVGDLIGPA
jgi:CheY-like chemotaxis protein